MLDFGTRMSSASEHDEDDLFAGISGEDAVQKEESIPEPVETEAETPIFAAEPEIEPETVPVMETAPVKETAPEPEEKADDVKTFFSKLPLRRRSNDKDSVDSGKLETAKFMKDARIRAGLTPEEVEAESQIRVHFLVALEEGYFDDLPPQVYVLAYLRKLCSLYKISKSDEEQLILPWREVQREVPDVMPRAVIPDDDSVNSKVLRRLEFVMMAAGAIVAIGIVTFLVIWGVSFLNKDKVVSRFDNKSLLELQKKPQLVAPAVPPVSRNR